MFKVYRAFAITDGFLAPVLIVQDGQTLKMTTEEPVTPNGGTHTLKGWGKHDGTHPTFTTETGTEIVIPHFQAAEETREQKIARALQMFVDAHNVGSWDQMDLAAELAQDCGIEAKQTEEDEE